ncbi:MAG: hypothetical protein EOP45_14735 [Sphingobacteriaceae bacterium]|nr:MAG: hypothetical protein EOP45_14735 [Sphingobacteriaceae bacterium]
MQPENGVKWFCYQHTAQFESEVGWLAHLAECASLLWTPFLCTFVEGDHMCKEVLKSAADLIYHVEHAHGKFLCDQCGSKHDNIADLQNHPHSHHRTIFGMYLTLSIINVCFANFVCFWLQLPPAVYTAKKTL